MGSGGEDGWAREGENGEFKVLHFEFSILNFEL
jgi:hypothetical protein